MTAKKPLNPGKWMEVMTSGQFTRDRMLRTKGEIEKDNARARALEERRRELFPDYRGDRK